MRKILLMSSALVVSGLLSGVADAACIQTPTCSSLGYTSSSSCTGGTKCPFGNAWNCTGPNNTTEIKNIKNEITNIKNRITKLENNSGSGSGTGSGSGAGGYSQACSGCQVGDLYNGSSCYSFLLITTVGGYFVYEKENGKCKAMSLKESESMTVDYLKGGIVETDKAGEMICRLFNMVTPKLSINSYFNVGYHDSWSVPGIYEGNDGKIHLSGSLTVYRSCSRANTKDFNYEGDEVGVEQYLSQFRMPKMITF